MQEKESLPAALLAQLSHGPASSVELQEHLQVSQPTVSRILQQLGAAVLPFGQARARRYARPLAYRELAPTQPLFIVSAAGESHQLGELAQVWGGYVYVGELFREGHYDGLPWFLRDQCPQGFLGRRFPQRYPELELPLLRDWQDRQYFYALARRGEDLPGDLLLGEESMNRLLSAVPAAVPEVQLEAVLCRRAESLAAGGPAQWSAAGEQPKFALTLQDTEQRISHRIIKYSPPISSPAGQRWADLLIAEHLALRCLQQAGYAVMPSRLHQAGDRLFLDSERYDRVASSGRRPMFSLSMVDAEFSGVGSGWTAMAAGLQAANLLADADVQQARELDLFGELIANTDRHAGNLALIPDGKRFRLAPVYDMLPMAWAPHSGGETPDLLPRKPQLHAQLMAALPKVRSLAKAYWASLAEEQQLSPPFRALAEQQSATCE